MLLALKSTCREGHDFLLEPGIEASNKDRADGLHVVISLNGNSSLQN